MKSTPPGAALAVLAAGLLASAAAIADDEVQMPEDPFTPYYRGRVTIGLQSQHTGSLIADDGSIPGRTETDTQALRLGLDYALNERWQLHLAVPYIRKRSNGGPGAHRLDLLDEPHPEASFLDDGSYHSNFQDWELGVSYHTTWRGFLVEPALRVYVPSHDYSFFANAATGQQLVKVDLGVDIAHRFGTSNFGWSAGYSYVFYQHVLGIDASKNKLRASIGWLATPKLTLRAFSNGSYGKGRDSSDFAGDRHSEEWYNHDRTSRHNYAIAGLGMDYRLSDRYTLSASAATMVWGRTVHDLKHAYELQLARSF